MSLKNQRHKQLVSMKEGLNKELDALQSKAADLRTKYNLLVEEGSSIRRQIDALDHSLLVLTGQQSKVSGDTGVVDAIGVVLAHGPKTLKELQEAIEIQGFSRHAVRTALNGISFSRTAKGLYVLRDHLYGGIE